MPFVNFKKLSPERRVHLSDQWHTAKEEFKTLIAEEDSEELSPEAQEALKRLHAIQNQLLCRQRNEG